MKRQTRLTGGLNQKYRAVCDDCEAASSAPVSERFAETQARKHADATGHEVTVVPAEDDEDDRSRRKNPVVEVFEGP